MAASERPRSLPAGAVLLALARSATAAPDAGAPLPEHVQTLAEVRSFGYQLANLDLDRLAHSPFDLLVVDYSRDGSEAARLTAPDVARLQRRPGGRPRRVLAYLSIGEAEGYRYYWQAGWSSGRAGATSAPAWLGPENPRWKNNYKVRYWLPAWRAIVLEYLDRILAAGFDGAYLDIIDAYEFWGPGGESGLDRASAAREMVELVQALGQHARVARGRPGFALVPQNGEGLAIHGDYLEVASAIGKEDLFFEGDRRQPESDRREAERHLQAFARAGRPVLVIDYVTRPALEREFYRRARALGFLPYAAVRPLDRLPYHPGLDP